MKLNMLVVVLFGLSACTSPSRLPTRRLLVQLATAQGRGNFAQAASYSRMKAQQAHLFPPLAVGDTLYLLERVEATGAPLDVAYVWNNHRQTVTKYTAYPAFRYTELPYQTFDDPLRTLTEQLDSVSLQQPRMSIADAPIVYISRLYQRGVDTYHFTDVTPLGYHYK